MSLNAISPIDGRYANETKVLSSIFSESALMRYRIKVEIEYLISLSREEKIKEFNLSENDIIFLHKIYLNFTESNAKRIKRIESKINHDVKAVEYFIKEKLAKHNLKNKFEFVHFALTSEDINNLSYTLMLQDGLKVYIKELSKLQAVIKMYALRYKNLSLLALTHGQAASPTTLGKEFAVFYLRIQKQLQELKNIKLAGKLSGATGNWNAHHFAYKNIDWIDFSKKFVELFGLEFNPVTTQIEPHDSVSSTYHNIVRINNIIQDLNQDVWFYIARGVFKQQSNKNNVGSSTMPHKINPIDFENSEGNILLANSVLNGMANKLQISRMQRDLSDSTVLRNQGVAIGYAYIAIKKTMHGLNKLSIDKKKIQEELDKHWEILTEPLQITLRKLGEYGAYEKIKNKALGKELTKVEFQKIVRSLKIPREEKNKLLNLTPQKYIGLAPKLVTRYIK